MINLIFLLYSFISAPSPVNKTQMLQLVNNTRQRGCNCGGTYMPPVQPVAWNDQLAEAATAHSNFMNKKQKLSHTGARGSDPGDRIRAAGYYWKGYGENIGYNYPDERSVVNGWLQSVNHCKNLMNPKFKEMGVGRSGPYWTQDFGTK